jgi:methyltransferase OMS1
VHTIFVDTEIGLDEFFMGMNLIRRWHLRKATGRVLEVGCGTGRNFEYYGSTVKQITAVDAASGMIQQAQTKSIRDKRVEVKLMNAQQLTFPDNTFDTVVDTFGLCSYEDPVSVLRELNRVCRLDGKILLIEHGRGSYDFINKTLDKGACKHATNWGCIWNRDIIAIIEKAGLRVTSVSRFHFGTTYLVEAKPVNTVTK